MKKSATIYSILLVSDFVIARLIPRPRKVWPILTSLASKPQVLENCPVLGSRTALFFEWLKFCRSAKNVFLDRFFFFGDRRKTILKTLYLWKTLAFVSLVLGLGFFCVLGLGLEPCILDSTSGNYIPRHYCRGLQAANLIKDLC